MFKVLFYYLFYNDANATRDVIGRCPWSVRVKIHGWRHGKFVFFVLFNITRGFENVCEILLDSSEWKPRKSLAGAIYKEEKWRNGIFTTVAIVCPLYERLAVLQNVFAIILPCARKNKKEKEERKNNSWHTRLWLVCHFFVLQHFDFICDFITEQMHDNMESIC